MSVALTDNRWVSVPVVMVATGAQVDYQALRELLEDAMLERGLTARDVGRTIGVPEDTMSRFRAGRTVYADTMIRIATWLMERAGEPAPPLSSRNGRSVEERARQATALGANVLWRALEILDQVEETHDDQGDA